MLFASLFRHLLWAGVACAAATSPIFFKHLDSRDATTAADILLQIAPTSGSCANPPAPGECATNVHAAPYLIASFVDYGVTNVNELAAVLSTIAFESGDFKYNIHYFPQKNPGQGTRAMLEPQFILAFIKAQPALASKTAATTTSGLSADQLNELLDLVLGDDYTWATGVFYLTSQCSSSVRSALQAGGQPGFEAYLGCLGVQATSDRLAYWNRAVAAFGLA